MPHGHLRAALVAILAVGAGCSGNREIAADAPPHAAPPASAPHEAPVSAPKASAADAAFAALASHFLAEYLKRSPVKATELGDHSHDARWPDLTEAGEADTHAFLDETRKALEAIRRDDLREQNRIDYDILGTQLASWSFSLTELRPAESDPLHYTGLIGDGIDPLITRSFAPLSERLESLLGRLRGVPGVVAAAKSRLKNPPKIFTETAIQQAKGLVALCDGGLADTLGQAGTKKGDLMAAASTAAASLRELVTFLEKDLLPRSTGSFRLGRARFQKKLGFALDDAVDPDAIAKGARDLLHKTQDEMVQTALELWPSLEKGPPPPTTTAEQKKALVKKILARVADDRPDDRTIVAEAKRLLGEATKFVAEKDLVRVPDEPCDVIEMPEYRRGVAIAYCDASGPLEKKQETFYAIAPTPKGWSKQRVDSFYREYNRSMLADLTVHEAMPGHFLQLSHNRAFARRSAEEGGTVLRAAFPSDPFVEGWAVYAEWVMAKHGFGGPKVRLQRQKMVLRLACNAILDHGVHAGLLDEKEALALMQGEAFQEEGEAVAKWQRARLSSAQLTTYYYGFTEMMRLRQELEGAPGFTERAYHDRLLGYGSPPMKAIRALMTAR